MSIHDEDHYDYDDEDLELHSDDEDLDDDDYEDRRATLHAERPSFKVVTGFDFDFKVIWLSLGCIFFLFFEDLSVVFYRLSR